MTKPTVQFVPVIVKSPALAPVTLIPATVTFGPPVFVQMKTEVAAPPTFTAPKSHDELLGVMVF